MANESVEDCLSRRIDLFDEILNNKIDVSAIVNKACEDNCQLNTKQQITIIQRLLYLQMAYFNILASDMNHPISFKICCENAIKKMSEIGINVIKSYQTIMQWNRVFRKHEVFPHPNYYVEMGKTDEPLFLETFPQVKIELCEWASKNIDKLSCESIGNELRQKIIPKTYNSYLQECVDNQPSMNDFL